MKRIWPRTLSSIALLLLGCSSQPGGRRGEVGVFEAGGSSGAAGQMGVHNPSAGGRAGDDLGSLESALSVEVQDVGGMMIEIVTIACAGACADVEAVARGGNPPYAFAWEDGSTSPMRHVCLDASTTLTVSATDTAIETQELGYEAQTARAEVTATLLDCSDVGVVADGGEPADDAGGPLSCALIPDWNIARNCPETSSITGRLTTEPLRAGDDFAVLIDSPGGFGAFQFDFYGSDDGCAMTELLESVIYDAGQPNTVCLHATRDFEHVVYVSSALGVIAPNLSFSRCNRCPP